MGAGGGGPAGEPGGGPPCDVIVQRRDPKTPRTHEPGVPYNAPYKAPPKMEAPVRIVRGQPTVSSWWDTYRATSTRPGSRGRRN